MKLSPGLHYANPTLTNLQDNIDFWYDSLNDCYDNHIRFKLIATYVEAINDESPSVL